MIDFDAIDQALADAVGVIEGLQAFAMLPDTIDPPTFATVEHDGSYQMTFGTPGLSEVRFSCGLYVSRGDTDAGRQALPKYLSPEGPTSIRAAIEVDRTLGGACGALTVTGFRGSGRLYEVGGVDFLGAVIDITVWA